MRVKLKNWPLSPPTTTLRTPTPRRHYKVRPSSSTRPPVLPFPPFLPPRTHCHWDLRISSRPVVQIASPSFASRAQWEVGMGGADGGKGVTYTLADVSKHNTHEDCWLVIDGKVTGSFILPRPVSISPFFLPRGAYWLGSSVHVFCLSGFVMLIISGEFLLLYSYHSLIGHFWFGFLLMELKNAVWTIPYQFSTWRIQEVDFLMSWREGGFMQIWTKDPGVYPPSSKTINMIIER